MHSIEEKNGQASFASANTKAWHGLGIVWDGQMTEEDIFKHAGLDFQVDKVQNIVPLPSVDENGDPTTIYKSAKDSFTTYRTDNLELLGSRLGDLYHVVQNSEAFSFFRAIVDEGEAIFETAGVLGVGERIFATAKLPEHVIVKNGDEIDRYLLLSMGHDGTLAIHVGFTPIRVVCENTLRMALNSKDNFVSIRHTMNADEQLKKASTILGIENQLAGEMAQIFNSLIDFKVDDKLVQGYVEQVFTQDAKMKEILNNESEAKQSTRVNNMVRGTMELYEVGQGQKNVRGNMFGAYNAITAFQQHVKFEGKDEEKRMKNNYFGAGAAINQKALVNAVKILRDQEAKEFALTIAKNSTAMEM